LEIIDKAWHVADQVDHVATAFGATWIAAGWSAVIDAEESLRVLQRELDKPRESQASNTREGLLALIFGALVMMGRVDEARALQEDTDLEVAMLPLGLYGDEVFSLTPESGERTLRERNKRFRRSGNQIGAQGTLQALGHLLARTGRIEEARAAYDDALSSFGTLSLPVELYTRAYLAVLDIETGDLDSAKAQLRRGEEIAVRGSGLGIQLALHLVARGMLAASEGRLDDANRDFAEAVDIDGRAHHPWRQAEALHLWGRALANTTQTALAIQKFDEAFSVYAAIGAGKEWTDQVSRDRERAATRASL
jgi:tetratricopeptide (TPR) repeat protein